MSILVSFFFHYTYLQCAAGCCHPVLIALLWFADPRWMDDHFYLILHDELT